MEPLNPIRFQDLYIPQPCHEAWEAMDATERGRFCQSCKKEVIDFTFKTQREFNEILASGTWSGCGRFPANRLGKAPVIESSPIKRHQLYLDQWRKGAAAALLFVSLWQMPTLGKAASKSIVCLVPNAPLPANPTLETEPNYILSAILLSEYGEDLPDDFILTLTLPNGDTIPVTTHHGFFGINLEGRAKPEDTIVITVPPQQFEDDKHKSKYEFTQISVLLSEGQNLRHPIHAIFRSNLIITTHVSGGPMLSPKIVTAEAISPSRRVVNPYVIARPDPEPLFKTRTPEERAEAKLSREGKKSNANRP